jgi:hypothetical protein
LQEGKMPYNIVYHQELDYFAVTIEEDFDLKTLQDLAQDMAKEIEKHGCNRILNDMRRARLTEGTLDIYNMPQAARRAGVGTTCKRALVLNELTSDFNFLETVFVNQGHQVKVFTDIDHAMHWLLNKEAD